VFVQSGYYLNHKKFRNKYKFSIYDEESGIIRKYSTGILYPTAVKESNNIDSTK